jgi:phosphoenolpyruvate synthase/pyruvate phosphate dikinase
LTEPDDAFFLTEVELAAAVDGRLPAAIDLVAQRRAMRSEYGQIELPATFTGIPDPVPLVVEAGDEDRPAEIGGSSGNHGVVEGRARVLLDPDEEADLDEGDILVCRATDPGWMALLVLAAGVVIDNGGETSHGAIVSRELGIPCVIGTGNGTSVINDHDLIRVDGTLGVVSILERASQL